VAIIHGSAIKVIKEGQGMKNDAIEKLMKQIESGYSLPALSPVAVKLVEIASDDNCSLIQITRYKYKKIYLPGERLSEPFGCVSKRSSLKTE
jgi:hypothetical protein